MNAERLLPLFPLLPVLGIVIISFCKYILKREIARQVAIIFTLLQAAAGILLLTAGPDLFTEIQVSPLDASIRFSFSRERMWLLAAFLAPAVLSAGKLGRFKSEALTTVFLFYLAASSGILVTADIFNFFVFYELMIMSAYVLISIQRKVYASIKYMLVGALSAVFFLTGIIFVYASGLPFSFSGLENLQSIPRSNAMLIITFFFTAFSIKSALFPASPWLPTCHSAGNGTVSAFLSSFTVVSGFFGMYHLVLLPAESIHADQVFLLLKIFSLITMAAASFFVFFDTDIKRVIAGSTAFAAGFIGFLFSSGAYTLAWIYIFVHSVYKSILFHSSDALDKQPLQLEGSAATFLFMGITLLFAGGIFPSASHYVKTSLHSTSPVIYIVLYGSAGLLLAGFFKFKLIGKAPKRSVPWFTYILAPILIAGTYIFIGITEFIAADYYTYILEAGVLTAAVLLGRLLFPRLTKFANIDSRYIFRTLSIELFALVVLFSVILVVFNLLPALY